jgi:hypothetical protein
MPNDALPTQIRVLRPDRPPVEGVQTLPTDLKRFFVIVRRVGRDSGLLLLTIRALRHRAPQGQPEFTDLLWILGTSPRRIRSWLETLSQAGLLVYDTTNARDILILEIADLGPPPVFEERGPDEITLHHEIPTHLFLHVLPRVGRLSFIYYLYLLAQETSPTTPAALTLERAVEDLALKSEKQARKELVRLERKELVAPHPSGVLLLRDPPPLRPFARRLLRLRARGFPPHVKTVLRLLFLAFLLLAPLFYLFFRPRL